MPLTWLGTLQERPSPLAQAFGALQPAAESLAKWLAETPDREKQMAQSFWEMYQKATPEYRQLLEQSPNFSKMVGLLQRHVPAAVTVGEGGTPTLMVAEEVERERQNAEKEQVDSVMTYLTNLPEETRKDVLQSPEIQQWVPRINKFYPGAVRTNEQGTLDFAVPPEVVLKDAQLKEERSAMLLGRVLGMDEDQRKAFEDSPEGQSLLQRVYKLTPHWFQSEGGTLHLIPNINQILDLSLKRAEIRAKEGEAAVSQATAETAIPARAEAEKAQAEYTRGLTKNLDAVREDLEAGTALKWSQARQQDYINQNILPLQKENQEIINSKERTTIRLLDKEIEKMDADIVNSNKLTDAQVKNLQSNTAMVDQNLAILKMQAPYLVDEVKARVDEINKRIWQIEQLTPAQVAELDAQTKALTEEAAKLAQETKNMVAENARAQELHTETLATMKEQRENLHTQTEALKAKYPKEAALLQIQYDTIQAELEWLPKEKAGQLAGLYANAREALARAMNIEALTPEQLNQLINTNNLLIQELTERKTLLPLTAAEIVSRTKLNYANAEQASVTASLAPIIAQANIDHQQFQDSLEALRLFKEDEWQKQRLAFDEWLAKGNWGVEYAKMDTQYKIAKENNNVTMAVAIMQEKSRAADRALQAQIAATTDARERERLELARKELKLKATLEATDAAHKMALTVFGAVGGVLPPDTDTEKFTYAVHDFAKAFAGEFYDEDAWQAAFPPQKEETPPSAEAEKTPQLLSQRWKQNAVLALGRIYAGVTKNLMEFPMKGLASITPSTSKGSNYFTEVLKMMGVK